ncbi:MAG: ROK family transcriptional regulator [Bacillota bacterium]
MSIRTGDRQLIKELNIALVMNLIRQHEPISRVEIAERTGLGRSTVTGIISTLLREGLVQEIGSADSVSGRKPVLLAFNAQARFAVGIKLAPRSATGALVDLNARVLHTRQVALNPAQGPESVIADLVRLLDLLLAESGVDREALLGAGLVMPGVVDPATGTAIASYFLGWANLPIRDILEQELDLPVYVDNDANAMALAEALYGAGRGVGDMLGLTVGVGIGSGVIIDGQIHRGARFSAGELGHTCVDPVGPACVCGRRGCLEAVAGDAAIVRRARQEMTAGRTPLLSVLARGHADLVTREMVVEAALAGDDGARFVLAEAGRWIGLAVGNAVNLLSPARVVVGGEAVIQAGDLILEPLRQQVAATCFPSCPDPNMVTLASLGANAWLQGAAALVLKDAFEVPIRQQHANAMARKVGSPSS